MALRYECDIDGLTDSWVEYVDRWSRGDIRLYYSDAPVVDPKASQEEQKRQRADQLKYNESIETLVLGKIAALHLQTADGDPITDPNDLTEENLDRIDYALYTWFGITTRKAIDDVSSLGEASGRRLFSPQRAGAKTDAPATK